MIRTMPESRAAPILRLTTEAGDSWDDPSEDALFEFMGDLDAANRWLVVVRLDDPGEGDACRLELTRRRFVLVVHEGTSRRASRRLKFRAAHEALTGWAFRLPDWEAKVRWS